MPTQHRTDITDLSGNDVALAMEGIEHALAWWKQQNGRRTKYGKEQQRRLMALLSKLNFMFTQAYPHNLPDVNLTSGNESIYVPDIASIRRMNARRRPTKLRSQQATAQRAKQKATPAKIRRPR